MEVSQIIGQVLAPTIMISACGLLLLGLQNKYSNIIDRIRSLNEERRKLRGQQLDETKEKRMANIELQIPRLLNRARLGRNSILFMYIGVLFFVLTSVFIGIDILFSEFINLELLTSGLFMIGLGFVFVAVVNAYLEIRQAYDIILIEVSELNIPKEN
ncbi:MAG: DUF2721 domain-containing protein [bacterium]|nr:DUF2721 domain-containing protein [bacterium]